MMNDKSAPNRAMLCCLASHNYKLTRIMRQISEYTCIKYQNGSDWRS